MSTFTSSDGATLAYSDSEVGEDERFSLALHTARLVWGYEGV